MTLLSFGNAFLDRLEETDRKALEPSLHPVRLELGAQLIQQGEVVGTVHFPVDAQLANVIKFRDGKQVEVAVIGREGLSGLAPFMARRPCDWCVVTRAPGDAWAIDAEILRRCSEASRSMMGMLLDLTHFYQTQASQTAACNAVHDILARLARWILTADDLTPGAALRFTQEELALVLGVRRTSINDAMTGLKAVDGLRYSRGVIHQIQRGILERAACECYELLRSKAAAQGLPLPESAS